MNLMICDHSSIRKEENEKDIWTVSGPKSSSFIEDRVKSLGRKLRFAERGGKIIEGEVVDFDANSLIIKELGGAYEAPQPLPIEIVLAVPRPIMLRRLIPQLVALGVRSIFLVASEIGEKSYLDASILHRDALDELVVKGLEQAVATYVPEVMVFPLLASFLARVELSESNRKTLNLVADPSAVNGVGECVLQALGCLDCRESYSIAIGPEAGWSVRELALFEESGFETVSLGDRVLRVETAAICAVSQLKLLLNISNLQTLKSESGRLQTTR